LRVCRVQPDVPALDKAFDYSIPDPLAPAVRVGTIVRVSLHGRRVRGWVVALDVEPSGDASKLLPIAKVAGAGPPAEVVDLAVWASWRWAGPVVSFLRAASPPNSVRDVADEVSPVTGTSSVHVLAWPPAADRRALVAERIAPRGSTLIVSADGSRFGALVRHLERTGRRVLVIRADCSAAERTRAWSAARDGGCVVLGGRSAVWAPVPDLAAVIVLDEADEALQEESAPTWNGRDVVAERARRSGAELTLVGVVPSLEAEALGGVPERPDRSSERHGWPGVMVVDLRETSPGQGLLTEELARAVRRSVDAGERVVCVLNRKGRARLLVCVACGSPATCERCGAAVAEAGSGSDSETATRRLACGQCGATRPLVCLSCHSARFKALRPGVRKLRDGLAALFPKITVAHVDADVGEPPDALVLVGTEAVLHRAQGPIGLVAFLDLDQELLAPRYRAAEQALALVARGARRAGADGRLLLQTRLPDHPVVQTALRADPSILPEVERRQRRELGYPPFGALAELSGAPAAVDAAVEQLRASGIDVLGPTPKGERLQALARSDDLPILLDALADAGPPARALGRLRVAVDPPRV
jgi:primosomal protein N' (replication factor Y)